MSTTPPPPMLPAGWYPDPDRPGQRYWDGSAWTESRAETPPQQAAAQAPKKRFAKLRAIPKWRWAVGATIVVLALAQELGHGNEKQSVTAERSTISVSASAQTAAPSLEAAAEAQLNQEVRDGTLAFTVTDVEMTKSIGDGDRQKTAQGSYVVITMNVKNVGDTSQSFKDGNQKLVDMAGREYGVDGGADYNLNKDVGAGLGADINPGDQIPVKIVFDLPPGAHPSAVELHDSAVSGGTIVRLP